CSSCGALYTTDYCCSDGSLGDKIICDLNQTPDLSQQLPQNCPKCGNPVDGQYCQGCSLLRKKFKEDLFTYCIENGILQDSSKPSNENTNVVNALQEPFVFNQDPGKNSPQSPPQINHHCCYGCGDPLEDIFCHQCTCELSNLVDESPNIFNPPPQPPLYSCEFYGNDARYSHYCTPQVPFIYPEPKFIKSSIENLVPNPSESECEHEYDVPACGVFTTFSNILFNVDYDFSSSDDPSFYDEDIPKEIYSNPLFDEEIISMKIVPHHFNAESNLIEYLLNCDSSIISSYSKIDSLFDEFAGELTLLKSIPPGINKIDCDPEGEIHLFKRLLYDNSSPRPSKEFISENSDTAFESFSSFSIPVKDSNSLMEEIDLSFTPDDPMPPGIEEDDYDFERDVLILEELLSNDSLSLPENESFHFDIPLSSRPLTKPPVGNSGILNVKMMGDISEHTIPMPRLMITQTILVQNQEKSPDLLPHLGHEAFQPSTKCSMMIYGKNTPILDVQIFHFYPP
nr:hypothetical protein [Tanacetum cinerariifolium]